MNFNSIKEAWKYGIDAVLNRGDEVLDERGDKTLELCNLMMTIDKPLKRKGLIFKEYVINNPILTGLWANDEALKPYKEEFTSPDKKGFVYTYGNRFHSFFDMGQVDRAIDRLAKNPATRRAVCVTWSPKIDSVAEDVPCLIFVDFKVRDGKLNTTGVWRSHDIFGAYYPNVVGLSEISKRVAEVTEIPIGSITTHSISAHIREHDIEEAKKIL